MVHFVFIMKYHTHRYRLSFTFGGLLIPEMRAVAETWLREGDWNATKAKALEQNVLGKTRISTQKRYLGEISSRLQHAYPWEISALMESEAPQVAYAIVARYYQLIGDVAVQVVRPELKLGRTDIDTSRIRGFIADQARAHRPLDMATVSTREKLFSVMIRCFREAGIFTTQRGPVVGVQRLVLSSPLYQKYCSSGTAQDLARMLWTDKEIAQCTQ